ncbi:hypothetical protein BC936DRAFT_145232, partial [Jimgerdemannia flammicorona]
MDDLQCCFGKRYIGNIGLCRLVLKSIWSAPTPIVFLLMRIVASRLSHSLFTACRNLVTWDSRIAEFCEPDDSIPAVVIT